MRDALLGRLARPVDRLGHALAQGAVVVDEGVADVGERQPPQPADDVVGVDAAGGEVVEQRPQGRFVHASMLPGRGGGSVKAIGRRPGRANSLGRHATRRVGFFGPFGTFTEQAVRSQPDLAGEELVAFPSVPDVLDAVANGDVDCGVVPIENSIEGVVNFTQDALCFDYDLLITREMVLDIELCLVGPAGQSIEDAKVVLSIPVATAQCHRFLREHLPDAEIRRRRRARPRRPAWWPRARRTARWPSRRASPPSCTASRCSPATSRTTPATRPASCSSPATASRRRPATTARRWSCTSGPTSRAA